jgi:hypothetical protein
MAEYPSSLGELYELFRGGAVVLITALLSWGILSTKKVCLECGRSVSIRLNFTAPGDPFKSCSGYCDGYSKDKCKSTKYYLCTGTLLDKRYSFLSIEAKVLLMFLFSCGQPPSDAHQMVAEKEGKLKFSVGQAQQFYRVMRCWLNLHNTLNFQQIGGLADAPGPGVSRVNLKAALYRRNPCWRDAENPEEGLSVQTEADEACIQTCRRQKVALKMQTGIPVRRQTHVERWICGCVDMQTGVFQFKLLPRGRKSRTRKELCEFLIDTCRPCTEILTDSLAAYSEPTLARAGMVTTKVNHNAREWALEETDTAGRRKSTNHIESLWNRVRRFVGRFNLQKQQCESKRRADGELPPLHYYLADFKFKHDNGCFKKKKQTFETHVAAFAGVLRYKKGGDCGTQRDKSLFPKS